MLVCIAGFTLMVPTRISLVMLAGAAIAIRRQVAMEERYLTQNHGDAYRRYARDVGRFLPWLGRLR
jgi:protein-S-isoprenylcysteine O-methyltransferase Ste14